MLKSHQIERILQLSREDWTIDSIATELGISPTTVSRYRTLNGFTSPRLSQRVTDEQVERMIALRKEGLTCEAIAALVGCGVTTVSRNLTERGEQIPNVFYLPQDMKEQIRRDRDQGMSYLQIANKHGIVISTVHRVLKSI